MGPENAVVAGQFVGVTPSTVYSPEIGYGWIKAPQQSFNASKIKQSNALTKDGLLMTDSVIYRVDMPAGKYFLTITLGNTKSVGDTIKASVMVNQRLVSDPINNSGSNLHYSTSRKQITIEEDYVEIKVLPFSAEVGLYGIELRPVADITPMSFSSALEQDTAEVAAFGRKLEAALDKNPEDITLINRLNIINKYLLAAYYYDIGWWSWAVESTGLSIFDRYDIASDLLRQVMADPRDPLYDKAAYLLGRIHFWLYKEQHEAFDSNEYQKFFSLIRPRYPDHKVLGMYVGEKIPNATSCVSDVAHAPVWANLQRTANCRILNIIHWWVDSVQAENGELGGKFGDDVEILRWWLPAIFGLDDQKARQGYTRLVEGVWNSGRLERAYAKKVSDVEHAAELFRDTHPAMILMDYGNPVYVERCLISMQNFRDTWTGITPRGHRHFKSCYFSATEVIEEPPVAVDVPMNARATLAGLWAAWYNRNPTILRLFSEWGRSWVEDADRTDKGKPQGILPAAVTFATDEIGGYSDNWFHPNLGWHYYKWENLGGVIEMYNQLLGMYAITGDNIFLKPTNKTYDLMTNVGTRERSTDIQPGSEEWAVGYLTGKKTNNPIAEMYGLAKTLTGSTRYDPFITQAGLPYSKYLATGDKEELRKGFKRLLGSLNYNFPMFTSEVKFTDRVYVPERELLFGMYTGHIGSGFEFPAVAVTWKNTGRDIAVLVNQADRKKLNVSLFNFSLEKTVTMRTWRLEPGRYRLKTGPDENDDGQIDKPGMEMTFEIRERMHQLAIPVPSNRRFAITIQQLEPYQKAAFSMPDLALSREHFLISNPDAREGETLQIDVTVHNIGNSAAKNIKLAFFVDDKKIDFRQISTIQAPNDLEPKWETVTTNWVAEKGTHRIRAIVSGREKEITRNNNEVSKTVTIK
ncbi:CARDB domain-containing protein [Fulvivirgaceae bacterium BMA12]|uniref:CARDB domain-containing protein n=1 Tax=Agaribacillus aureus TaxID=3051825 RepID=A0ABT8LJE1_9BACT|nr:CARDB domain-containing protein [Fulvivirgaceae bacterium BMA12]